MSVKFLFLTKQFYSDFISCPEIEQKPDRPHVRILVRVENIDFAVPMRSHINHPNAYLTDKVNKCGVDYSKAIVITDAQRYVETARQPRIRQNEFDALRGKEYILEQGMRKYLKAYVKALEKPEIPRNAMLLKYSTLQYFHEYILPVKDE